MPPVRRGSRACRRTPRASAIDDDRAPAAPIATPVPAPASAIAPAVLHPLVHANTSNLLQQRYVSPPGASRSVTARRRTRMLPPPLALERDARRGRTGAPPQDTGGWEPQRTCGAAGRGPLRPGRHCALPRDEAVDVEIHGVEDTDDRVFTPRAMGVQPSRLHLSD
jgi:hypothetical protein